MRIRLASLDQSAGTLSGGNQQKVVLGNGCWRAHGFTCSMNRREASTSAQKRRSTI
jgi:ABC-type uncharacterized transport system ATPase subunit